MPFVTDTFTDTNGVSLVSHTGETGATWTKHASETGTAITIQTNEAKLASTPGSTYYASGAPATAEYDVSCVLGTGFSDGNGVGVLGRLETAAYTGYLIHCSTDFTLYKVSAGSYTSLGSYAATPASGGTVKLQIRTAAKKVFVGGVERVSSANDDITAAGKTGIRLYGTTSLTSVSADDVAASGGTTNITASIGLTGTGSALKTAIATLSSDLGASAQVTATKIAVVNIDNRLLIEGASTASPIGAITTNVAAVLGIDSQTTAAKIAIAALAAALGPDTSNQVGKVAVVGVGSALGVASSNTAAPVLPGIGTTNVLVGLGADGTVAAIKLGTTAILADAGTSAASTSQKIVAVSIDGRVAVSQLNTAGPAPVVSLNSADLTAIADAVWAKVLEGISAEQMMRVMMAALSGKREGLGTATEKYMARDGVTPRITLTPDANGNGTPTVNGS